MIVWLLYRCVIRQVCIFQGPLSQQIIPGNVTVFVKEQKRSHVYALSANTDTGSSGMAKDWICVYDYYGCE